MEIWSPPIKSLPKTEDSSELYIGICVLFEPETSKEYQSENVYIASNMPLRPAQPWQVQFYGSSI